MINHRLAAHLAKPGNQRYARQADHFTSSLDYSWVGNLNWREHERLELENDLIATYVLATGEVPAAQFLG